ncbi:hypothetical protein E4U50_000537 [Claviceps purpurea]|nr:hypothetical protein E4U50_000537 [Claviceps purpurea]
MNPMQRVWLAAVTIWQTFGRTDLVFASNETSALDRRHCLPQDMAFLTQHTTSLDRKSAFEFSTPSQGGIRPTLGMYLKTRTRFRDRHHLKLRLRLLDHHHLKTAKVLQVAPVTQKDKAVKASETQRQIN